MFELNNARLDIFDIDDFVSSVEKHAADLNQKFHEKLIHAKESNSPLRKFLTDIGIIANSNQLRSQATIIGLAECLIDYEKLGHINKYLTTIEYLYNPIKKSQLKINDTMTFSNHVLITTNSILFKGLINQNHVSTIIILTNTLGEIIESKSFMKVKSNKFNMYFSSSRVLTIAYKDRNFDIDAMRTFHKELYVDYCIHTGLHEFGNTYEDLNPSKKDYSDPISTKAITYLPLGISHHDVNVEFTNDFIASLNEGIKHKLETIEEKLGNRTQTFLNESTTSSRYVPQRLAPSEQLKVSKLVNRYIDMKWHKFNIETEVLFNDHQLTKLMAFLASMNVKTIISFSTLRRLSRIVNKNKYRLEQSRNNYIENMTHIQKSFYTKIAHINDHFNLNLKYHQIFSIINVLPMDTVILKQDVGLGKTRCAIAIILARGGKHNLIVTEPGNVLELEREFKEQLQMGDVTKIIKNEKDILSGLKQFNLIGYSTFTKVIKESSLTELNVPPIYCTDINTKYNIYNGFIECNKFASSRSIDIDDDIFNTNTDDINNLQTLFVALDKIRDEVNLRLTTEYSIRSQNRNNNTYNDMTPLIENVYEIIKPEQEQEFYNIIDNLAKKMVKHEHSRDVKERGEVLSTLFESGTQITGNTLLTKLLRIDKSILRKLIMLISAKVACKEMKLSEIVKKYKFSTFKKYSSYLNELDKLLEDKEINEWFKIDGDTIPFSTISKGVNQSWRNYSILNTNLLLLIIKIVSTSFAYFIKAYIKDLYSVRSGILEIIENRKANLQQTSLSSFSSKQQKIIRNMSKYNMTKISMYNVHSTLIDIISSISEYSDEIENLKLKAKYRTKMLGSLLNGKINTLVYDECQALKNITGTRYIAATQLKAKHYLFMSATPVGNHMGELLSYLTIGYGPRSINHLIDMEYRNFLSYRKNNRRNKKSYTAIVKPSGIEYELDITNNRSDIEKKAFPIERLNNLVERNVVRVLRDDTTVVQDEAFKFDLKAYRMYSVPSQEHMALYAAQMEIVYRAQADGQYEDNREALRCLMNLIKISEIPHLVSPDFENTVTVKQNMIAELAKKHISTGRSVIVFTQFQEMVTIMAREISNRVSVNVYMLGDNLNADQRFKLIDAFRKEEGNACIVGTVNNLGKGFNLACADVIIMSDLPWSPLLYTQSIGRILRPDQKGNPEVFMIMNKYMIDMYKFDTIMSKLNMIKKYLDQDSSIAEDQTTKVDYKAFIIRLLNQAINDGVLDGQQLEETTLSRGV